MAFRLITPLIIAFSFFLYLGYLNPSELSFVYAPDKAIKLPFIGVLLIAFFSGALSFVVINTFYFFGQYVGLLSERYTLFQKSRREKKIEDAQAKRETGRVGKALKSVDKVLARDARNFDALMLKGNILRDEGKFKEAVEVHSLALAQRPKDRGAIIQLNEDYAKARRPDAAYRILERARVLHPSDTEIMGSMRDLAETMGDLKRSIVLQREIVKKLRDSDSIRKGQETLAILHCKQAFEFLGKGENGKAEEELISSGKVLPGFIPAIIMLSNIAIKGARPDDAVKILRREFKRSHSIVLLRKLESIYSDAGLKEEGIDLYRWAMGVIGEAPASRRLLIFLAMSQIKYGDYIGADGTLNRASEDFDGTTIYNLARGIVEMNNLSETEKQNSVYEVLDRFKKALDVEWDSYLHYICNNCGRISRQYFISCSNCGKWNSASVQIDRVTIID